MNSKIKCMCLTIWITCSFLVEVSLSLNETTSLSWNETTTDSGAGQVAQEYKQLINFTHYFSSCPTATGSCTITLETINCSETSSRQCTTKMYKRVIPTTPPTYDIAYQTIESVEMVTLFCNDVEGINITSLEYKSPMNWGDYCTNNIGSVDCVGNQNLQCTSVECDSLLNTNETCSHFDGNILANLNDQCNGKFGQCVVSVPRVQISNYDSCVQDDLFNVVKCSDSSNYCYAKWAEITYTCVPQEPSTATSSTNTESAVPTIGGIPVGEQPRNNDNKDKTNLLVIIIGAVVGGVVLIVIVVIVIVACTRHKRKGGKDYQKSETVGSENATFNSSKESLPSGENVQMKEGGIKSKAETGKTPQENSDGPKPEYLLAKATPDPIQNDPGNRMTGTYAEIKGEGNEILLTNVAPPPLNQPGNRQTGAYAEIDVANNINPASNVRSPSTVSGGQMGLYQDVDGQGNIGSPGYADPGILQSGNRTTATYAEIGNALQPQGSGQENKPVQKVEPMLISEYASSDLFARSVDNKEMSKPAGDVSGNVASQAPPAEYAAIDKSKKVKKPKPESKEAVNGGPESTEMLENPYYESQSVRV